MLYFLKLTLGQDLQRLLPPSSFKFFFSNSQALLLVQKLDFLLLHCHTIWKTAILLMVSCSVCYLTEWPWI